MCVCVNTTTVGSYVREIPERHRNEEAGRRTEGSKRTKTDDEAVC